MATSSNQDHFFAFFNPNQHQNPVQASIETAEIEFFDNFKQETFESSENLQNSVAIFANQKPSKDGQIAAENLKKEPFEVENVVKNEKSCTCFICDEDFDQDEFDEHIIECHAREKSQQREVEIVNQTLNYNVKPKYQSDSTLTNTLGYICAMCGKSFVKLETFQTHLKSHMFLGLRLKKILQFPEDQKVSIQLSFCCANFVKSNDVNDLT